MSLQFHNTLTKNKQIFKPIREKENIVHMYNCGPTVYNFAHIGNYRAYICSDILKKYLQYKGYKVLQVMNITDVEDKIIRDSQKEHLGLKEFTDRYTQAFMEDLEALNISKPNHFPKATEHIPEMVKIIQTLLDKDIAYKTEDGIYFNIKKFPNYGKLSHINLEQTQTGKRVANDEYNKEHVQDFALWKFWDEKDGNIFWETAIGKGRPGWHIECSAMSMKWLGEQMDIHTGGIDLIFPHHENEIAQSEACTGKQFVKYWLHNDYILVDGKKMSKSLGNFYTLRDILKKGYKPAAIRYLLLSSHYRQQLNFTLQGIDAAASAVERYGEFYDRINKIAKEEKGVKDKKEIPAAEEVSMLIADAEMKFEEAMDDDLEISPALAAIFELIHQGNKIENLGKEDARKISTFIERIDAVLGLLTAKEPIPAEVLYLCQQREEARKAKNWQESDRIRNEITAKGYKVADSKDGFEIKKV
ncbi:cysteine--tRNA ligase [Candidatus Woesearchaeota archaeon]|nr:cysteine--tRNA ligase [Candidatus Woesearchaeota archaeon]